jgi:hypothetical protein
LPALCRQMTTADRILRLGPVGQSQTNAVLKPLPSHI